MMSMKKSTFCLVLIASMMLLEFTPVVEAGCDIKDITKGCCNCSRQSILNGGGCAPTGVNFCASGLGIQAFY